MDLATLQPWGIYASMVAVAVSVIGLSFQIHINTRSLRSYSYSRALDRLAAVQSRLSTDTWWLSLPGVVEWWRSKPAPFNPKFSQHVEQRIGKPAHDRDASRRWLQFLEGRTGGPA